MSVWSDQRQIDDTDDKDFRLLWGVAIAWHLPVQRIAQGFDSSSLGPFPRVWHEMDQGGIQ